MGKVRYTKIGVIRHFIAEELKSNEILHWLNMCIPFIKKSIKMKSSNIGFEIIFKQYDRPELVALKMIKHCLTLEFNERGD